jgi:adenylate cyclase
MGMPRTDRKTGTKDARRNGQDGGDVNIASRVAARSAAGEVLVTRPVVERAGPHLDFERVAEVRLKGFSESTEVFLARQSEEEE